jgi:Protein of unknown function (DUF1593)
VRKSVCSRRWLVLVSLCCSLSWHSIAFGATPDTRLRVIIETDAGGDPDDEQSLVRFLLYANEWDVEGIIANRPHTSRPENKNPEPTGLGVVCRLVNAYGQCYSNLTKHDARYPKPEQLLRTRSSTGGPASGQIKRTPGRESPTAISPSSAGQHTSRMISAPGWSGASSRTRRRTTRRTL